MQDFERELILSSPDVTVQLAQSLGEHLVASDVVLLHGDLGSGKTHFARALIKHRLARIGMDEDVPSPTYTLVQTYDDGEVEIWHADLYRISEPDDVYELGLPDAFETAICLIEWPEVLGADITGQALSIWFSPGSNDSERKVRLSGHTPHWRSIVETLSIS